MKDPRGAYQAPQQYEYEYAETNKDRCDGASDRNPLCILVYCVENCGESDDPCALLATCAGGLLVCGALPLFAVTQTCLFAIGCIYPYRKKKPLRQVNSTTGDVSCQMPRITNEMLCV